MRFILRDGIPFLVSGGREYPVEITEKGVSIGKGKKCTLREGYLTLQEVIAKIGYYRKAEPEEEKEK